MNKSLFSMFSTFIHNPPVGGLSYSRNAADLFILNMLGLVHMAENSDSSAEAACIPCQNVCAFHRESMFHNMLVGIGIIVYNMN